ncbi:DMP19 family protein [Hallella colorans]|uniref:DMP19 family protein n=1 Tax=Hallella colorans TaxID=1703337 RepID=UPI00248E1126|nr:DMP19 family protein [Hallella colorans]
MIEVRVKDFDLRRASQEGMDAFVAVFSDAILKSIGDELNADNMSMLNSDQITLIAYVILRDELMSGGFVQLIHNGYGDFIYRNPFDKAVREWGLTELYRIIHKTHRLYSKCHEAIEQDCTQEEFDALYEQHPEFDVYDDAFVELEEDFTTQVAHYVDENIENFAIVEHE